MWPRWAWIVVCVLLGQTLNQKDPRSSHTLHPRHAHSPIAKVTFPTTSLHPGALQLPGPYLWEKKNQPREAISSPLCAQDLKLIPKASCL